MTKSYRTLAEFEALPNDKKINRKAIDAILDRLCYNQLCGVLSRFAVIRILSVRQWLTALGRITGRKISLRTENEEITPYMSEAGVVCFCKRDLYHIDRLFMIAAHESAHFILMQDENYALLKKINGEYLSIPEREKKMNSPIELCANIITLEILERCKKTEKSRKKQQKIEICIKTLKKQLT